MPDGRVLVGPNRSALTKEKLAAKIAEDPAAAWQTLSSGVQKKALEVLEPPGNLYKVDLPDDKIARMLDWDNRITDQPFIAKALRGATLPSGESLSKAYRAVKGEPLKYATGYDVERFLTESLGFGENAADLLKTRGIPGVRYLDQGSRGVGAGTSNFVVFPGEEQYLRILERNGLLAP
jgi:hypothetical protein